MGPLGFGERLLWVGFVGPDRCMIKAISQVPLGPRRQIADLADSVMSGLHDVLADFRTGTTVALLLTRPASRRVSRKWTGSGRTLLAETAARLRGTDRADLSRQRRGIGAGRSRMEAVS